MAPPRCARPAGWRRWSVCRVLCSKPPGFPRPLGSFGTSLRSNAASALSNDPSSTSIASTRIIFQSRDHGVGASAAESWHPHERRGSSCGNGDGSRWRSSNLNLEPPDSRQVHATLGIRARAAAPWARGCGRRCRDRPTAGGKPVVGGHDGVPSGQKIRGPMREFAGEPTSTGTAILLCACCKSGTGDATRYATLPRSVRWRMSS